MTASDIPDAARAAEKRFATLRAELARGGYQLHAVDAGAGRTCYLIIRWAMQRELPDLDAVAQFLDRVRGAV